MNALRTEDELRNALQQLSTDAPTVERVLPRVERPRRKLAWLAPVAAALLVLAVAAVVVVHRTSTHSPAGRPPARLVGQWRLQSVGSHFLNRAETMHIGADGKFWANFPPCGSVRGDLRVAGSAWQLSSPSTDFGMCPGVPLNGARARRQALIDHGVRRMFTTATITWSLTVDKLTLRRPGVPTLVYFRRDRPRLLPIH